MSAAVPDLAFDDLLLGRVVLTFDGRVLEVRREELRVVVRRRVRGDELGAGVEEELLEGRDAFLSVCGERRKGLRMVFKRRRGRCATHPRDILPNCSP